MTWRELARAINAMPDEVKDFRAEVWMGSRMEYLDGWLEFPGVAEVAGYDGEKPLSIDNPPSIELYME